MIILKSFQNILLSMGERMIFLATEKKQHVNKTFKRGAKSSFLSNSHEIVAFCELKC